MTNAETQRAVKVINDILEDLRQRRIEYLMKSEGLTLPQALVRYAVERDQIRQTLLPEVYPKPKPTRQITL